MDVVVDGVQAEVQSRLVGSLKLATAVLLIAYHGLQRPVAYQERVVEHGLVMSNFLEGFRGQQLSAVLVALALYQARLQVVVRQLQMRIAPAAVDAHHTRQSLFVEL